MADGGGGFHQQVLGAFHRSTSGEKAEDLPKESLASVSPKSTSQEAATHLPKKTKLGTVLDIFTGTEEELPAWLEKNKPSNYELEKDEHVSMEVFPGFDVRRSVVTSNKYEEKTIDKFLEHVQAAQKGDGPDAKTLAYGLRIWDGKWFCFFHKDVIDDVWAKVARGVVTGTLPSRHASVGLGTDKQDMHILSVFVHDSRDSREKARVERELRAALDEPRMKMIYRPLFISYLHALDADTFLTVRERFKDIWSRGDYHQIQASREAKKQAAKQDMFKVKAKNSVRSLDQGGVASRSVQNQ